MFSEDSIKTYPQATNFFTKVLKKDKLANSYLFISRNDENISSFVIDLAQILNCSTNAGSYNTPCKQCINCKWLEKNEHPQALLNICPDATSKKENIKIESIRELLNTLNNTSDFYRVIFFSNANLQSLPPDCCNLLLKTIEEPPEKTLFIFRTNSKNDMVSTIISRSQMLYLNKTLPEMVSSSIDSQVIIEKINLIIKNNKVLDAFDALNTLQELISTNNENVKNCLTSIALNSYKTNKNDNPVLFCKTFKALSKAYSKNKAFMQNKVVFEDLFLEFCN